MTVLLFALIYRYVPRESIPWGDVWIGATVTALLFTIGKYLIGVYLARARSIGLRRGGFDHRIAAVDLLFGADLSARRRIYPGVRLRIRLSILMPLPIESYALIGDCRPEHGRWHMAIVNTAALASFQRSADRRRSININYDNWFAKSRENIVSFHHKDLLNA